MKRWFRNSTSHVVLEPQRLSALVIQVVINDRGIMEWKRSIALINDPPPIPHLQVPFYDRPGSIVRTSFVIERYLASYAERLTY